MYNIPNKAESQTAGLLFFPLRSPVRCWLRFCGGIFLALAWLGIGDARAQTTNYTLGATDLLVGPDEGTNSIVLAAAPPSASWTNTANASWLHLSADNQSGTGSTNVVFTYDPNPSVTRSGTLTIAGQTLTVTQADSTYVPSGTPTELFSAYFGFPGFVAVDGAGNVYIADYGDSTIKEWSTANTNLTTLVSSGLKNSSAVALDAAGNLYIADTSNHVVKEWTVANSNVVTLVSSGLELPVGVAVDVAGNVYIADYGDSTIKEWLAGSNTLVTLSSRFNHPVGVAVDDSGNVYIGDSGNHEIKEWSAAGHTVTNLVEGLNNPYGVAVDGAGNIYIGNYGDNVITEWSAASQTVTNLVEAAIPLGVAVNSMGDIYFASDYDLIEELPYVFVDPAPKLEGLAAGSDVLPAVLPTTENLLPPFAPTSEQSWLTITGVTNGVVSLAFTADIGPARTANITLLGQTIPITQGVVGTPPILAAAQMTSPGVLQFVFTNNPSAAFTVLSSTNLSLPLIQWTIAGAATETSSGVFQFTSSPTTNHAPCFYCVRSP